ncbi:MAG: hypothetical protein RIQ53_4215 [Pseudomonadota bacterium]
MPRRLVRPSAVTSRRVLLGAALAGLPLLGCAAPPGWTVEPPRDDAQWLWGVGSGPGLDEARRAALRQVAAHLRSTISGSLSRTLTEQNGRVDAKASSTVSEAVLDTEFSRYELARSDRSGGEVFALVKVDRPAFIRDTQGRLALIEGPLAQVEATLAGGPVLEQYLALQRNRAQIDRAVLLSQLLLGAGLEQDGLAGVQRWGRLAQRGRQIAGELAFELRARPDDGDIADTLGRFLGDLGMRSSLGPGLPGQPVVQIQTSSRSDTLYGNQMLKLGIQLTLLDAQGRTVARRLWDVAGGSRYDLAGARRNALTRWSEQLTEVGSLEALGLAP